MSGEGVLRAGALYFDDGFDSRDGTTDATGCTDELGVGKRGQLAVLLDLKGDTFLSPRDILSPFW